MLSAEQIQEFHECGFTKGDVILNDSQIKMLLDELQLVMDGKTERKPVLYRDMLASVNEYGEPTGKKEQFIQIVNIWMASDAYLQLALHPVINEDIAQLTGADTLRLWHDQIVYKPPLTGGPTYWHQDFPAWPLIEPADLVGAWVALDDAVVENGCMWMVPGSHKWGNHSRYLTSDDNYMPVHTQPNLLPEGVSIKAVPVELKKGQVGYHHCMTWHGGPNNRSGMERRGIAYHYMPGHTRYVPSGYHQLEPYIEVKPNEILAGKYFPVTYTRKP